MTRSETEIGLPSEGPLQRPSRVSKVAIAGALIAIATVSLIIAYTMTGNSQPQTPAAVLIIQHSDPPFHVVPANSTEFTFATITRDVEWSDIRISLSDQDAHNVTWLPSSAGLSGGSQMTHDCGNNLLGNITVTCNVTDLSGNGIPNTGDRITLTTIGEARFVSAQEYVICLFYIPDGCEICSKTFSDYS